MTILPQELHGLDFNGAGEILFVDKPLDWTSFDVIRYIKRKYHIRKLGHAGTLDPKATGLLIICTGPKTKAVDSYMGLEKEYLGVMELGIRTDSFDSEGKIVETRPYEGVTEGEIRSLQSQFVGKIKQIPPMYSAVKFGGKPLYKLARKGRTVEREPKEIEVSQFDISDIDMPRIEFRVVCSKGTYIRALVEDFGLALGCGATLRELRRTRIGPHHVSEAIPISALRMGGREMMPGIEGQ